MMIMKPWDHSVCLLAGDSFHLEGVVGSFRVGHPITFHSTEEVIEFIATAEKREVTEIELPIFCGLFGGRAKIVKEDRYFLPKSREQMPRGNYIPVTAPSPNSPPPKNRK